MSGKKKNNGSGKASCRMESIVSVDERGQMVLPKDLRERAGLKPGDKLAVTSWEMDGKICCITLVKTDSLVNMVKAELGPVMNNIINQED